MKTQARDLGKREQTSRGKFLLADEPHVFHCNHYNYWLQNTLLLPEGIGMDQVLVDAASRCAFASIRNASRQLSLDSVDSRLASASEFFSECGFGTLTFDGFSPEGGVVRTPTSHYGQAFTGICPGEFRSPQNTFDRGFAAGAAAAALGVNPETYLASHKECLSLGAKEGRFILSRRESAKRLSVPPTCGVGHVGKAPISQRLTDTNIDEDAILAALAGLNLYGNEEGLIPKFGVLLTLQYANYYNLISFEFVRRMADSGLLEYAEELLVNAGYLCAFNTFGGIMTSPEWDAVVLPSCQTWKDWVHGMVAIVNALGWGVWRISELEDDRIVVRIYDDYESSGYLGLYGQAERPVSYLAQGGVAGLMNLVRLADVCSKPELTRELYLDVFESKNRFVATQTKSLATGDPYTEVVAECK